MAPETPQPPPSSPDSAEAKRIAHWEVEEVYSPSIRLKKGSHAHPSGRRNALNDLSGSEWAQSSKSVMSYEDQRSEKQKIHGASFPQSLAEHHIMIYTKKGEVVLDPFVGVGTTLDACAHLGRKGIGVDINPAFIALARSDLERSRLDKGQRVIEGDARDLSKHVEEESVDFIFTSPPYADLLNNIQARFLYKWKPYGFEERKSTRPYSRNDQDIGNLPYEGFLKALKQTFVETLRVAKEDTYAAWVVRDFRDLKRGRPLVNFHGDLIRVAEEAGWRLWDIRVYDQTRFRPLVILGIPSRNFYLNIGHSYIVVFRKESRGKRPELSQ